MKIGLQTKLDPAVDPNAGGGGGGNPDPAPSQADLAKGIEKARMEERVRLKDQLTALTTQLETVKQQLTSVVAEKEKVEAEFNALKTAHDALKAGMKAEGGIDVEKAIQTAVTAAKDRLGPALQQEIASLRTELAQERSKRETAEAEQTRTRLIAEAGGTTALIPELVTGRTPEEIAASIESSKQIFARTIGAAASGSGGSTASASGNPNPPTIPLGNSGRTPNGSAASGNQSPFAPGGGRIPLNEFAKNRQQMKQAALSRARGA